MGEKAPTTATEDRLASNEGPVVTNPDEHGNTYVIHKRHQETYTDDRGNTFVGSDLDDPESPTHAEAQRQIDTHRVRRGLGGSAIKSEVA